MRTMDPEACLLAAETAIMDGEENLAIDALENYVNWRGKGGYEPTIGSYTELTIPNELNGGDAFFSRLITQYETKFGPYLDARLP